MISANGGLPAHRYTPQVTPRWPRGSEPASQGKREMEAEREGKGREGKKNGAGRAGEEKRRWAHGIKKKKPNKTPMHHTHKHRSQQGEIDT